jgi:hypothetical protein
MHSQPAFTQVKAVRFDGSYGHHDGTLRYHPNPEASCWLLPIHANMDKAEAKRVQHLGFRVMRDEAGRSWLVEDGESPATTPGPTWEQLGLAMLIVQGEVPVEVALNLRPDANALALHDDEQQRLNQAARLSLSNAIQQLASYLANTLLR